GQYDTPAAPPAIPPLAFTVSHGRKAPRASATPASRAAAPASRTRTVLSAPGPPGAATPAWRGGSGRAGIDSASGPTGPSVVAPGGPVEATGRSRVGASGWDPRTDARPPPTASGT